MKAKHNRGYEGGGRGRRGITEGIRGKEEREGKRRERLRESRRGSGWATLEDESGKSLKLLESEGRYIQGNKEGGERKSVTGGSNGNEGNPREGEDERIGHRARGQRRNVC